MKELHDYFYGTAVACLIALGTGFLSVPQYAINLDKEAKQLEYQIEENENIIIDKNTECNKLNNNQANCNYVKFLSGSVNTYLEINGKIGNYQNWMFSKLIILL